MGLFAFVKGIGEKLVGRKAAADTATPEQTAQETANLLLQRLVALGLKIDGLAVSYNGTTDTASIAGVAATQADKEKAVLAVGNVDVVAQVEDNMTVAVPEPDSRLYTVKSGDNLSKIAKEMYGDANKYPTIFEANKPMLAHPDKIFPGQVLRIPG